MTAMVLEDSGASDRELIGLAQGGDRGAFGELVERHYDFVFRAAYRWTGHRADAEDVAQDVCVRLGRAIRNYRGDGAFTTWLYALTLNAVRDAKRKTARDDLKTAAYGIEGAIGGGSAADEDPADALWAAVRQLPDKQRDAVLLVYGEGLTHAAAADVMGVAEATVSWHVHESKKRLKQLLRSAGEV